MKKKILSFLLAVCLVITLVPMVAFAAEAPLFGGGTGTQEDPWLIASQEDLTALAEFLNSGNAEQFDADAAGVGNCHGYYFKQTADIDLTGVTWEPIGYSGSYYFAGNYDGGGHSITNAVSTGKVDPDGFATAGIFGWVAFGSVENLHVKNANFVATGQNNYSYVGGIAGVCYGSSIKNCSVVISSLESKRNNNNNCAGSIVGYSTGGTFEKCAAENNQVKTMAYGGGFVGEVDDDYGVGKSTFTNCYTANCSVSSKTDDAQGVSLVGGFAGEMTDSLLTIQNCYVYQATLFTEGTAVPGIKATGVFAGQLWGGSTIGATNCYYGACGITENAGTAGEKTEEDFTNGTVAGLLGDAFAQARNYPRFADSPADYSAVDAAIAKANALKKDDYKDFSAVEAAVNAVVRDKNITEQSEVDAMAQAIEDAITALQYKDADYTKVDEAIAKAKALNKDDYKDFSAVEAAVNAVVRDKNITEQSEVDAMAKAIESAIAALEKKQASAETLKKINGKWYYIKDGKQDLTVTKLVKYGTKWYYVKNGVVDFAATTLVKQNTKWYYVKNGVIDFSFTGLTKYNNTWFYVYKGVVKFNSETLVKYNTRWYYVKNGRVDFKYTGNVTYKGSVYYVKNGVMQKKVK